ncbi:MAG: PEP-CTERM sorting domain-containing protein [Phycisphaerae bacterium]
MFTSRKSLVSGLLSAAALAAVAGVSSFAAAATIVDEPFNYPSVANGATMNGVAANAIGLTGNYALTNLNSNNTTATMTYSSTPLAVGNLAVSGGSVVFNSGSAPFGELSLSAQISASTTATTIYGSYVFQVAAAGSSSNQPVSGVAIGPSGGYDKKSLLWPSLQSYGNANAEVEVNPTEAWGAGVAAVLNGPAISSNTPYLTLFEASGVGASSGTLSMSEWILDAAQYNYFTADGDLTPQALSAASTGTLGDDVLQSGTVSAPLTSASPSLNGQYLSLFGYAAGTTGAGSEVTFGEYRISDSSLSQAAPAVPEPATLGLVAMGGLGLLLLKRRKTV